MNIKDMAAFSDFTEAELENIFADVGYPDFDFTPEQVVHMLLDYMRMARDTARAAKQAASEAFGLMDSASILLGDMSI